MPYVSNVKHDIFLSYAHGNETLRAWSLKVNKMLLDSLGILLGDRENALSGFTDEELLAGNGFITPQLQCAAENSAALVVVMSEHYIKSPWCKNEIEWFGAWAKRYGERAIERVFVIRALNVPATQWPPFLRHENEPVMGYGFCDERQDAFPYGWNQQQEQELGKAITRLSRDLAQFLRRRRQEAEAPAANSSRPPTDPVEAAPAPLASAPDGLPNPSINGPRPRVFVGFSTEDLESERTALSARLAAGGALDVVAPRFPADVNDIHGLTSVAASEGAALVQLCGRASGRWVRNIDGFVAHQIRLFEAKGRPTWLLLAAGMTLRGLPTSSYTEFLASREAHFKPEPSTKEIVDALVPGATQSSAVTCTVFIQSRKDYASAEQQLREHLLQIGQPPELVDTLSLPIPPLYRVENPQLISALLDQRRQRNGDIQAGLLILADKPELLVADLVEYRREMGVGPARRPVAIVDASTDPTVTGDDIGYPIFRLEDPAFRQDLAKWLRDCVASRSAAP